MITDKTMIRTIGGEITYKFYYNFVYKTDTF